MCCHLSEFCPRDRRGKIRFLVNAVNHAPKIKRWLGIPADQKCYSAMTVGFPDVKYLRLVHRDLPKVDETRYDLKIKA
jgi:hypothetical protein